MSIFLIPLILFSLYLPKTKGETQHDNSLTPHYNTGICKPYYKLLFDKVCNNSITYALNDEWQDLRAPVGTPYIIFRSRYELNAIFVSFHKSPLFDCNILVIRAKDDAVMAKQRRKTYYEYVSVIEHSDIHCIAHPVNYPAALLAHCERRRFDPGQQFDLPVLHYSRYGIYVNKGSALGEPLWLIPLAITLLAASLVRSTLIIAHVFQTQIL